MGDYSAIAKEYYNPLRHPTCDNFRLASITYLKDTIREIKPDGIVLEVGSGYSALGQILSETEFDLSNVILSDRSIEMLAHSQEYFARGAMPLIADATALPLVSGAVHLIIASLGDPYNVPAFWSEVARCLAPNGYCLFTTPSFEWATQFRSGQTNERAGLAYFELENGRSLYVPSLVYSLDDQRTLLNTEGLKIAKVYSVSSSELSGTVSSKLRRNDGSIVDPITGYLITKAS